jgi:hypothetical protein
MPGASELEAVVEAVVRALVARHRAPDGRVAVEAVVGDALQLLPPLLRRLAPEAAAPANGRVIVERDVLAAEPGGRLVLARGAVVTPLARDTATERRVELVWEAAS